MATYTYPRNQSRNPNFGTFLGNSIEEDHAEDEELGVFETEDSSIPPNLTPAERRK